MVNFEVEHAIVELEDGSKIISGNINALVNEELSKLETPVSSAVERRLYKNIRQTLSTRIPDVGTPGVKEISWDELTKYHLTDQTWTERLWNVVHDTTNVYSRIQEDLCKSMPKDEKSQQYVGDLFDHLVSKLDSYEERLLEKAFVTNANFDQAYGIDDKLMNAYYEFDFDDLESLPKTTSDVLRQFTLWAHDEWFANAMGNISAARNKLLDLKLNDFTPADKALSSRLSKEIGEAYMYEDQYMELTSTAKSQLETLAAKLELPEGSWDTQRASLTLLSDFAPTYKAWKTAVQRMVTDEDFNVVGTISGWPGGKEFAEMHGYEKPKKKKKRGSKSRSGPKSKRSASSREGSEDGSFVTGTVASEDMSEATQTIVEEPEEDEQAPSNSRTAASSAAAKQPTARDMAKQMLRAKPRHFPISLSVIYSTCSRTPPPPRPLHLSARCVPTGRQRGRLRR